MSKKVNNGRYELPEELKDILDATALLYKRVNAYYDKECETVRKSDIKNPHPGEWLKPLGEARDNMSEVAGSLLAFSENLMRDQYYVRMDILQKFPMNDAKATNKEYYDKGRTDNEVRL